MQPSGYSRACRSSRRAHRVRPTSEGSYQPLERLAEKAGDTETAEVARQNHADEEEMVRRIDASWDRTLELTLQENGWV